MFWLTLVLTIFGWLNYFVRIGSLGHFHDWLSIAEMLVSSVKLVDIQFWTILPDVFIPHIDTPGYSASYIFSFFVSKLCILNMEPDSCHSLFDTQEF